MAVPAGNKSGSRVIELCSEDSVVVVVNVSGMLLRLLDVSIFSTLVDGFFFFFFFLCRLRLFSFNILFGTANENK